MDYACSVEARPCDIFLRLGILIIFTYFPEAGVRINLSALVRSAGRICHP